MFIFDHTRAIIAYCITLMFFYALIMNPGDKLLLGALIGAFSGGAVGYYLGNSKKDDVTQPVEVVNDKDSPVPTEPQSKGDAS